jgi:GPI ethanolamine phosphate transferase 1
MPACIRYHDNIHRVDTSIALIVERFERFFRDNSTAYVFTADHGMSNKGSHGDGEPANTQTPFVVWGAGVAEPDTCVRSTNDNVESLCGYSPESWATAPLRRKDIEQADLAPLMVWRHYASNNPNNTTDHYQLGLVDWRQHSNELGWSVAD